MTYFFAASNLNNKVSAYGFIDHSGGICTAVSFGTDRRAQQGAQHWDKADAFYRLSQLLLDRRIAGGC